MGNYQKKSSYQNTSQKQTTSQGQSKEYINGIFVTKREGQYGEFFSLGIKKDELIKTLQGMEADDKGFVNLTMTPQKSNASKYSVYVNNWKPEGGSTGEGGKKVIEDDDNSLPF